MSGCVVEGCDRQPRTRGYCRGHYHRLLKYGSPTAGRTGIGEARRFFEETVLSFTGDDCLIWPFTLAQNGYPRLTLSGKSRGVHRLVCEDYRGPPPTDKHEAAHSCGNCACVNRKHLRWRTRRGNEQDKVLHGTMLRGATHNLAKLTEANVRVIRTLRGKETQPTLAARFNVTRATIGMIQRRESWRHLA